MSTFARMLFSLAKTQAAGIVVRSCFSYWSFLLPVKRLYETPYVLAFYHPKPAYPHHIVIVPKKAIADLLVLSRHSDYAAALLSALQEIVTLLNWEQGSYVFCANGGHRQEVQHVHFHLFKGASSVPEPSSEATTEHVFSREGVQAICYPQPDGQLHLALIPQDGIFSDGASELLPSSSTSILALLLSLLPSLDQKFHLVQRGYTFFLDDGAGKHRFSFAGHIVAGTVQKKEEPVYSDPSLSS